MQEQRPHVTEASPAARGSSSAPAAAGGRARNDEERRIALWAVALGLFFTFLTFRPFPSSESDYLRIGVLGRQALDVWNHVETDLWSGRITRAEAAARIERDVLPPWTSGRRILFSLQNRAPTEQPDPILWCVFEHRQLAWEAQARFLRTGDSTAEQEYRQNEEAAALYVERLRAAPTTPGAAARSALLNEPYATRDALRNPTP